jgi:hypothetical protein
MKNLLFPRTLVNLTKILILTKKTFWQITSHSCHSFGVKQQPLTSLLFLIYQTLFLVVFEYFYDDYLFEIKHVFKFKSILNRYIPGSSTCSKKELSITMTIILHAAKGGLQSYCDKVYSLYPLWLIEWVSDCCLMPIQQFFSYIMARTS